MAMRIDEVIAAAGCDRVELETWIAERWVLPVRDEQGYAFAAADLARVRLICDLRHDLEIETETLPVVLGLIDQVHELRRRLMRIAAVAAALPEPHRSQFLQHIGWPEATLDDSE